jgi:hypothetical protein
VLVVVGPSTAPTRRWAKRTISEAIRDAPSVLSTTAASAAMPSASRVRKTNGTPRWESSWGRGESRLVVVRTTPSTVAG